MPKAIVDGVVIAESDKVEHVKLFSNFAFSRTFFKPKHFRTFQTKFINKFNQQNNLG